MKGKYMCYSCDADDEQSIKNSLPNMTPQQELGWKLAQKEADKQKSKKVKTWTTRDGYKLRFKDMATAHIYNCLGLLNRKELTERPEYDAFLKELWRRGEFDLLDYTSDYDGKKKKPKGPKVPSEFEFTDF